MTKLCKMGKEESAVHCLLQHQTSGQQAVLGTRRSQQRERDHSLHKGTKVSCRSPGSWELKMIRFYIGL